MTEMPPLLELASESHGPLTIPIYQRRYIPPAFRHSLELLGWQYPRRGATERLRLGKLRHLMEDAATNVLYHRELFCERGIAVNPLETFLAAQRWFRKASRKTPCFQEGVR